MKKKIKKWGDQVQVLFFNELTLLCDELVTQLPRPRKRRGVYNKGCIKESKPW